MAAKKLEINYLKWINLENKRPKTGGRKKGTPNKITGAIKVVLKDVLEKEVQKLPEYLERMSVEERVNAIIKLLPYIVPRLKQVEYTEPEQPKNEIDLDKLTAEEGRTLLDLYKKAGVKSL